MVADEQAATRIHTTRASRPCPASRHCRARLDTGAHAKQLSHKLWPWTAHRRGLLLLCQEPPDARRVALQRPGYVLGGPPVLEVPVSGQPLLIGGHARRLLHGGALHGRHQSAKRDWTGFQTGDGITFASISKAAPCGRVPRQPRRGHRHRSTPRLRPRAPVLNVGRGVTRSLRNLGLSNAPPVCLAPWPQH